MMIFDHIKKSGFMNSIYKIKMDKKFKKQEKEKEQNKKMLKDVIDTSLPISLKPSKDGWWIEINDMWVQCMVIGRISPKYGDRQDYPTELNQRFMDRLFEIGNQKDTAISLCQVVYPLNPLHENEALETARRNIKIANIVQEEDDKFLHQHDVINDLAAEGIYEYQKQLYHGTTKLFHHVLLASVQGLSKKAVTKTIKSIETVCDENRILHELPRYGMVETWKSMQPTPYIWSNLFKKSVPSSLCAKTSLLRSPDPILARKGRLIGMNDRTGNPIHFDFDDPNIPNANALVIGVSGSGKSVDLLKDNIRAYLDGDHVVHIVPKKDGITDHLRVCKVLGGLLWKFGRNGRNPNMFQVFFDETTMDTSVDGYQDAYLAHFTMLLESIGLLIGSGYSDQQKNWLTEALSRLYEDFHVIDGGGNVRMDNVDKWKDGEFWPCFTDLRNLLFEWINDETHKKMTGPIEALYNNTAMLTPNGPLGYLVNHNIMDLSNPYIVADLSALSAVPNVQEALTLMIMSAVYTKLAQARPGAPVVRTLLTLDEGADLVKNPTMKNSIEKFYRQGRSWGLYTKTVSQDLAGYPRDMLDMLKANSAYVLLFANMRPDNVGPIKAEFGLDEQSVRTLTTPGKGHGLLIIQGHKVPYYNDLDDFERAAILNKGPLAKEINRMIGVECEEQEDIEGSARGEIMLNPVVSEIVHDLKVSCKTWYNKDLKLSEYPNGWEKATERNPFTGLNTVVFYKKSLLGEDGKIKGQTTEHYFMNALLAGEFMLAGAESVETDNNYGKDLKPDGVAKFRMPNGRIIKIAWEYETKECKHSIKDLQEKRDSLVLARDASGACCYDEVIFISKKEYTPHLIEALGGDFTLVRGAAVSKWLESIKAQNSGAILPQLVKNGAEEV
jgi:hypothetical protein